MSNVYYTIYRRFIFDEGAEPVFIKLKHSLISWEKNYGMGIILCILLVGCCCRNFCDRNRSYFK